MEFQGSLRMEEGGGRVSVRVMWCEEDVAIVADFDHGGGHEPRNAGSF